MDPGPHTLAGLKLLARGAWLRGLAAGIVMAGGEIPDPYGLLDEHGGLAPYDPAECQAMQDSISG